MSKHSIAVKYVGDKSKITDELRQEITEFLATELNGEYHFPEGMTDEDEQTQHIIETVNRKAKERGFEIEATKLTDEMRRGGLPSEIMDAVAELLTRLNSGGAQEGKIDPKYRASEALEFGAHKFFEAYHGHDIDIPNMMSNMTYSNLHILAEAILRGVDDTANNKEQIRRVVFRMSMLTMLDHYINDADKCGMLKQFKLSREDLLGDIHALAMDKVQPLMKRLSEQYNTLIDDMPGVLSDALH